MEAAFQCHTIPQETSARRSWTRALSLAVSIALAVALATAANQKSPIPVLL